MSWPRIVLLTLVVGAMVVSPVAAQVTEVAKLTPSDHDTFAQFGWSVSLRGDRALVGSLRDGDLGIAAGAAYVYERDPGGAWLEAAKLLASDGGANDFFGYSIALAEDRALVSAWQDDAPLADSGSVYVFERDGSGAWVEVAKLTASDAAAGDLFGSSVSLWRDRALVGAFGDDGPGSDAGSAYVFERDASGAWVEVAKLEAVDGAEGDHLGWAVALSGDRAVVGAWGDDGPASDSGSAYVFERQSDGAWVETARLTAADGVAGDWFGYSVSLSGRRALVGARYGDGRRPDTGSAYVFERQSDGAWVETAKLTATDLDPLHDFGFSTSLSGDRAVVGAFGDDDLGDGAGAAYVFKRQASGAWIRVAKLKASDGAEGDSFGVSVSLSKGRVLVGANAADAPLSDSGSAYVFGLD